jgi:hypothetical protein
MSKDAFEETMERVLASKIEVGDFYTGENGVAFDLPSQPEMYHGDYWMTDNAIFCIFTHKMQVADNEHSSYVFSTPTTSFRGTPRALYRWPSFFNEQVLTRFASEFFKRINQ